MDVLLTVLLGDLVIFCCKSYCRSCWGGGCGDGLHGCATGVAQFPETEMGVVDWFCCCLPSGEEVWLVGGAQGSPNVDVFGAPGFEACDVVDFPVLDRPTKATSRPLSAGNPTKFGVLL